MPNNWELSGNAGWFDGAAKVGYKFYPSLKCVAKSCVLGRVLLAKSCAVMEKSFGKVL